MNPHGIVFEVGVFSAARVGRAEPLLFVVPGYAWTMSYDGSEMPI